MVSLTPAAVKQEVNFLESSEISLHKTTVNLKTEDIKSDLARLLIKLHQLLNQKKKKGFVYICIRTSTIR